MLFDLNYKLNSGEKLVTVARKHWFLVIPRLAEFTIIITLLIIFANKFISAKLSSIIIVLIVCFIIYLIYVWILLRIDYFIITNDRVIKVNQKGAWNRNLNEILISDISSIVLIEKGIAASVLGFGSIEITLKGSESFKMASIIEPIKVYQGLTKLKEIKKNETR